MGIETYTYKLLSGLETEGKSCLCLGYPDLLVDPTLLSRTYPDVEDADKIRAWHNWKGPVPDTSQVMTEELGLNRIDFVDIVQARGPERVVDLNYPAAWDCRYDIVIDGGTAEHCFNIGQVFQNIMSATAEGGVVIHVNPLNMINHGFWNISPTAYADFYIDNGFEFLSGAGVTGPVSNRHVLQYNEQMLTGRFVLGQPAEVTNIMAFRRLSGVGRGVWPMQTKYKAKE